MRSNQTCTSTGRSYSLLKRGFFIMCSLFILSFFSPQSAVMAQDSNKAEEYYNKAMEYEKGDHYVKSVYYLKKAMKLGYADAYYQLGLDHEVGWGFRENVNKAIELYEEGAKLGSIKAAYAIGVLYYKGKGKTGSYEKGADYLQMASDGGYAKASSQLAFCYYEGRGREQDYSKALELWQKALEIDPNVHSHYGEPEYCMGECYFWGRGTESDKERAKYYYEIAAQKKWGPAQGKLNSTDWNTLIDHENDRLVEKAKDAINSNDYEDAYKRLDKVLKRAPNNEEANKCMGYLYYNGKGVTQDKKKGLDYYDKCNDDESVLLVGLAYLQGDRGYDKDLESANRKLDRESNNPEIQYYSAEAKYQIALGNGDVNTLKSSNELYTKAAANGSADAKKKLAQWATLKAPVLKKAAANEQAANAAKAKKQAEKEAAQKERDAAFAKLSEGDGMVFSTEESSVDRGWIFDRYNYRSMYIRCMVMENNYQGTKMKIKITEIKTQSTSGSITPRIDGYKVREGDVIWVKNPSKDKHWMIWE